MPRPNSQLTLPHPDVRQNLLTSSWLQRWLYLKVDPGIVPDVLKSLIRSVAEA